MMNPMIRSAIAADNVFRLEGVQKTYGTGDAAVLVDPLDPHAIAQGIYRVLTDHQLRRDLRARGAARARQFSWETSVRRVREIYQEAAAPAPSTSLETSPASQAESRQ